MHKPNCTAIARVTRRFTDTTKTGKPFVTFLAEMPPRTWNGKTYTERIEARTFRPEAVEDVYAGDWITVTGEAEADLREYQGKPYARLVITGTVSCLPVASTDGMARTAAKPTATGSAAPTQGTPEAAAAQPATPDGTPPSSGAKESPALVDADDVAF